MFTESMFEMRIYLHINKYKAEKRQILEMLSHQTTVVWLVSGL